MKILLVAASLLLCEAIHAQQSESADAITQGILVLERELDRDPTRIQLTGGPDATLWLRGDLTDGSVAAEDGHLELLFKRRDAAGQTIALTLSRDTDAWVDQDGDRWLPRDQVIKADPKWSPVLIKVTSQDGKPLGEFEYHYTIDTADGLWDPLLVRPLRHHKDDDQLKIPAPPECVIRLHIDHPDRIRGFGTTPEVERKANEDTLTASVRLGRKITGTVVADSTGQPLAGATVAPAIFTPPLFTPDHDRAVVTDADGKFEIRGVDFSFHVEHPRYVEQEVYFEKEKAPVEQIVRLEAGTTIRGRVSDPSGEPLAGVKVRDGTGKSVVSGEDGSFVLEGLRKWSGDEWWLEFSKDGYNEHDLRTESIGPDSLEVELSTLPLLRGRVVLEDGSPVASFHLVCGPGAKPHGFECVKVDVQDEQGRFEIKPDGLPEEGSDYWLGVRAEGAAPWDGVVPLASLRGGDCRVVLARGSTLTATLKLPASATGALSVTLDPTDREPPDSIISSPHPGRPLATCELDLAPGDPLRIPHLRAGAYQLRIEGRGLTPIKRIVTIGGNDVALGELSFAGTGTISGLVMEPYQHSEPRSFADGGIMVDGYADEDYEPYMSIKTDARGRFRVEGVPTGTVTVFFDYHETADIIGSQSRRVRVVEGKESELRFEGPGGSWAQPLRLNFDGRNRIPAFKGSREVHNINDGDPGFRFDIAPLGAGPASWPDSVEWEAGDGPALIPDLSPGRWKIRVFDWLGSRGFNEGLRAELTLQVDQEREPATIELGARSLSGRVTCERETRRRIRVLAVGTDSRQVFLSRCDGEGNFVIRYLPADRYLVHAHDDEGGWCDLGTYHLNREVVDCGEHELAEGGHVSGTLEQSLLLATDLDVRAVGADGVEIPVDELRNDGSFRFDNLRPGKWTIRVSAGQRVKSMPPVEIRLGATARLMCIKLRAKARAYMPKSLRRFSNRR